MVPIALTSGVMPRRMDAKKVSVMSYPHHIRPGALAFHDRAQASLPKNKAADSCGNNDRPFVN
jgi:hypothetical protein